MPMHDWTSVNAGLFHHFHQGWCWEIGRALNGGRLPEGYTALVEQRSGAREADVLTIETEQSSNDTTDDFCDKIVDAIRSRIHVLVVDLFPPTRRDPFGVHKRIWDHFEPDEPFELPGDQDRVLASYEADGVTTAFIETLAVGEPFPAMPLFIAPGAHILVPLEETYSQAWAATPQAVRRLVE